MTSGGKEEDKNPTRGTRGHITPKGKGERPHINERHTDAMVNERKQ